MAKLSSDPINKEDLDEYLSNYSDFSFEMSVLKELNNLEYKCEHGGTYQDLRKATITEEQFYDDYS